MRVTPDASLPAGHRFGYLTTRRELAWPADRDRGRAAAWHLHRSLELLLELEQERRAHWRGWTWRLRAAGEHLRIAHGFLGAVGFEHGWRLSAPAEPV